MKNTYSCAVTGHRPSRFKFKYAEDYSLCKKIKKTMREVFQKLHDEESVRRFYVGGALGVDMWAAEEILRLKEQPGVYPAALQPKRSDWGRGLPGELYQKELLHGGSG